MVAPASGAALWLGCDLQERQDWIVPLDDRQVAELAEAADRVRRTKLDLAAAIPDDFRFPALQPLLEDAAHELRHGRGFLLLRGLPAADNAADVLGTIFYGIGTCLGTCVSQSAEGDRLGHVVDRGSKDRYYTAGGPIEFHVDPVDVVGLLCLRPALAGGQSRIVSSAAVHNIILDERPDLLDVLYRGFHCSRKGHGQATTDWRVPVFAQGAAGLESYLLPLTILQAEKDGYALDETEREALAFVQAVAGRPGVALDMDFRPGDIQFLSNRVIFHARTDYEDSEDPAERRHLLRLWLMMPGWPAPPKRMRLHTRTDRAGGGVMTEPYRRA
jgi:hypothetical protein